MLILRKKKESFQALRIKLHGPLRLSTADDVTQVRNEDLEKTGVTHRLHLKRQL